MKNIAIITPIYPGEDFDKNYTKVVAYFAENWSHHNNVMVFHVFSKFPNILYYASSLFKNTLSSIMGHPIPHNKPKNFSIERKTASLAIVRLGVPKWFPGQIPNRKITKLITEKIIEQMSENNFTPDVAIGHWLHPSSGILSKLSDLMGIKTKLVIHIDPQRRHKFYNSSTLQFVTNKVSGIGFRSHFIQKRFIEMFPQNQKHKFLCPSGIPDKWVDFEKTAKNFNKKHLKILFVGTLIKRKHPSLILDAVNKCKFKTQFEITFIGSGKEKQNILNKAQKFNLEKQVKVLGQIPRDEVLEEMNRSDILVMISKKEAFGLVYLEAMANGLIVVGSRNEGMDGIIIHGENGFLCKAGDHNELSNILNDIHCKPFEELVMISSKALKTSQKYRESVVSQEYLKNILK